MSTEFYRLVTDNQTLANRVIANRGTGIYHTRTRNFFGCQCMTIAKSNSIKAISNMTKTISNSTLTGFFVK